MDRTTIARLYADAEDFGGKELTCCGWIRSVRDMKNFGFVTLNDGSCFKDLQVVVNREAIGDAEYERIVAQSVGAALIVRGVLELTPDRPQPFELQAAQVVVEGASSPDYPMQKKRATREFLRTQQHLRSRTNLFRAVFRIRSVAAFAIHEFFQSRGFVYINTPIITASDAEGAGEMFRVTTLDPKNPPLTEKGEVDWSKDFFGKETNLTVSGQLQAENFALAFGDVYTFGPTFRAENSNTRRHAAEFWMIEPEMAFADLADDMACAQDMLQYVINHVLNTCPDELAMLNKFVDKGLLERLRHVATSDFTHVTYTEAISILEDALAAGHKFEYPVRWGIDLQTEHERYLTEEHFKKPTFVTDYPKEIKAFYMRANDDGKTVAAVDCLVPGIGEIIGGSQREERLELLEARIKELGMDPEQYKFYCDLRRYGSCRHAGFGLGFERLVMYLTGVDNIRDVLPHPRTVGNADFLSTSQIDAQGRPMPQHISRRTAALIAVGGGATAMFAGLGALFGCKHVEQSGSDAPTTASQTDAAQTNASAQATPLYHFPDETAPHEGTWLNWPHPYTYGKKYAAKIEDIWVQMTSALVAGEKVHVVAYDEDHQNHITDLLGTAGVDMSQVDFLLAPTDDVWSRDTGPMFVFDDSHKLAIVDFAFDGWGKKTKYKNDDALPKAVAKERGFEIVDVPDFVLEGGSVELSVDGTLLATKSAVISKARNAGMSQATAEGYLTRYLGATRFIWLDGVVGEDITDAHIDGFARFWGTDTLLTVPEQDFFDLYENITEADWKTLTNVTNAAGEPYKLVEIPLTQDIVAGLDYRGSYLNYYVANACVLVPVYGDKNDELAVSKIAELYPDRKIVPINVSALYANGGMIHCVTQQQPAQ